ncbi:hypothetical protein [Chitinimonas koreensis]|uniref:hypothetical protein n=1 Tax=Chitinimonas koreensis TaxID=356302 RepID=UPI0012FBFF98|nr:hypothetical protein [Chitinimonas koreensis]QNM95782.1 hypothetical protein H9L41_18330 [Chitinimonas koreensis]
MPNHIVLESSLVDSIPEQVMLRLAKYRPIFHSEADLQHAFAWELQMMASEFDIRLEVPLRTPVGSTYLDLLARSNSMHFGIELKYKTRALQCTIREEEFILVNQAGQNIGRYDFYKDISRIETFVAGGPRRIGYALFLTNDSAYWKAPVNSLCKYAAFAMNDGRQVPTSLAWGEDVSSTYPGREAEITISGAYALQWRSYTSVNVKSYGAFKYLCIEVRAESLPFVMIAP